MAHKQAVPYDIGYEHWNGAEGDDAYWLEAALRHDLNKGTEAAGTELSKEEAPKAPLKGIAPDMSDFVSPLPHATQRTISHICSQCGVSFSTQDQFTYGLYKNLQPSVPNRLILLRTHFPSNPRNCCFPACDRPPFKYSKDLRRHINDIHNTTRSYRCQVEGCRTDHLFKRNDNLQRHIREQHPQYGLNLSGLKAYGKAEHKLALDLGKGGGDRMQF